MTSISLSSSRKLWTSLLVACLLTVGFASTASAQPKIATVDLKKIFEGYYKTKQADNQLRERGADAEKQYKGMLEEYQKANEDYKKLVESANDQAVAADERDKRKKSAEAKVLELNEIEKTLTQFKREKQATFDEQKRRMRDQIVREIREQVNNRARSGAFTLVIDSSAESVNAVPFILFNSAQNDLTDEILKQMNLSAPPGSLDEPKAETTKNRDIKLNIPDQDKEPQKETAPAKPAKKK
jgi:outer membrane protein